MPSQHEIDRQHLLLAFAAARMSKDPAIQVGAVLLGADGKSISTGYNGFPAGTRETRGMWYEKDNKYPRVIHAELNAILNAPFNARGGTIYCTLHICGECLGMLINAGIQRAVSYGGPWKNEPRPDILAERMEKLPVEIFEREPLLEEMDLLIQKYRVPPVS